jgi:hypothetical protein
MIVRAAVRGGQYTGMTRESTVRTSRSPPKPITTMPTRAHARVGRFTAHRVIAHTDGQAFACSDQTPNQTTFGIVEIYLKHTTIGKRPRALVLWLLNRLGLVGDDCNYLDHE